MTKICFLTSLYQNILLLRISLKYLQNTYVADIKDIFIDFVFRSKRSYLKYAQWQYRETKFSRNKNCTFFRSTIDLVVNK